MRTFSEAKAEKLIECVVKAGGINNVLGGDTNDSAVISKRLCYYVRRNSCREFVNSVLTQRADQ